tara:strand:+ start:341 stop:469 length:129 start_codon:yes stop_codon:yes gene_type:complete
LFIANPVAIGIIPLSTVKREGIDIGGNGQKQARPFWGAVIIP